MLWPVEFDAAARPRPGETDERGLDDRLFINEFVTVGLVLNGMNASADFRQHQYPEKFVFNPDRLPCPVHRLFGNAIGERQRINSAAAALIDPLLQKHRILVRCGWKIGGNDQLLLPDIY